MAVRFPALARSAFRWRRVRRIVTSGAWVFAVAAPLGAQDDWFARDKAQHYFASATIAAGGYAFGITLWDCKRPRALFGAGLSLTAGVLKEWSDARGNGQASWKDMAWNVLGIASALAIAWHVDDDPARCDPELGPASAGSLDAFRSIAPPTPGPPFDVRTRGRSVERLRIPTTPSMAMPAPAPLPTFRPEISRRAVRLRDVTRR